MKDELFDDLIESVKQGGELLKQPRVSLIINTACEAPHAATTSNPFRESAYSERAQLLGEIIDAGQDFTECLVSGSFHAGDGYTYVRVDPVYSDRRDALYQREMGARTSTGDILCFTHDDHLPQFTAADVLAHDPNWDILVPKRIHGKTGETLPNGRDEGYMGGHTLLMRRDVWVAIPWLTVETARCWDLVMTDIWLDEGLKIEYTDELVSVDLEAAEGEE